MHWLNKVQDSLSAVWRWLRYSPKVTTGAVVVSIGIVLLCQALGYHVKQLPVMPSPLDRAPGWVEPPFRILFIYYLLPYFRLIGMLGSVLFMLRLARVMPSARRMIMPTMVMCGFLAVWSLLEEVRDQWEASSASTMGEPFSLICYSAKIGLLMMVLLSPPFMIWWYSRRSILERYTLQAFLQPLIFCFAAFTSLWVLMDLLDNLKDFQDAGTPFGAIMGFYVNLIPYIFVSVAPAVLLLSSLYGLNKMSRANEIVSMLTAGRSLGQILRPTLIVTAYASVIAMAANYHWAPRGEGRREAIKNALTEKRQGSTATSSVMYRNEETRRTWYVGSVPFDLNQEKILRLNVREMDEKGHLVHGWYGASARWWRTGKWSFYRGIEVVYEKGVAKEILPFEGTAVNRLDVDGWPETPWSIVSASLLPDNLSVSDLVSYLSANEAMPPEKRAPFRTHLFQRFALPWECFVVVFMAAPLGVAFSRRGALGGIAGSVFIFFGLLFMNNLFLNMGKGARMPPLLAVWMPHLILGSLGALFFYLKSQNKELPKISFKAIARRFKSKA